MATIKGITFYEITRPLKTQFITSQGGKDVIKGVIIKVSLSDGAYGIGEAPTSLAFKDETLSCIKGTIKEIRPWFLGIPIEEYKETLDNIRELYPHRTFTISGLEVALFRAWLASTSVKEYEYWGANQKTLETDLTIPFITDLFMLDRWIKYGLKRGFRVYKLKVIGSFEEAKGFLSHVNDILKRSNREYILRLDGNQGFTEKVLKAFMDFVIKGLFPVELFEQPLEKDDLKGMKEAKRFMPIPVILDETVCNAKDLEMAIEMGLGDGINIKIAKSGISQSLKMCKLARENGLRLMIGCMTETMIGLSAAIFLAAGTEAFDYIDLDSIYFLNHKRILGGIAIDGPCYRINP